MSSDNGRHLRAVPDMTDNSSDNSSGVAPDDFDAQARLAAWKDDNGEAVDFFAQVLDQTDQMVADLPEGARRRALMHARLDDDGVVRAPLLSPVSDSDNRSGASGEN